MGRKRAPEHDWICLRCTCPCNPPGAEPRHLGGGQDMRACRKPPVPILRSEYEADMEQLAAAAVKALKRSREDK